ncbi:MAG: family 78 glycoside hydrolase catalytic domain [Clostridia bacterium]|nr:family 78 glycoside hydrolase catalytic domain [Clostridia bacterium]
MFFVQTGFIDGGRIGKGGRISVTDTQTPVFSWAVQSDAVDACQSACRITVSDENAVYYDSGWVQQKQQQHTYAGAPLPHGTILTVQIEVQDQNGNTAVPYTAPFTVGVLNNDEICGSWIGSTEETEGRVLYFRRDLTIQKQPVSACLYAAGIGYQAVTINGVPVTDAKLEPAHSNYAKLVYYTVHPDAAKRLTVGHNVIGIQVAEGWRNNYTEMTREATAGRTIEFEGRSQLWAMLVLTYADGSRETIATDDTWGVKFGAVTYASIFNGETYDAAKSDPMWNSGTAGTGFVPAAVVDAPGGILRPMTLEPIRQAQEFVCKELTMPKPGMFVADFGQNIAGVVRLQLPKLKKGQTVTLRFAEELDEEGCIYTVVLRKAKCTDTYIASGDARDLSVWVPSFTYHGFRYCEIVGLESLSKPEITALLWCTDLKNGSFFTCGSALINALQKNIVMTEMDNMHSILTDCPQRDERMGWMNDATVRFEETPYNFDIGRMFPKIVRDIRAEQRSEGQFTCCCPFYFGGLPADPVCSSYLVAGYEAWMHTDNAEILREGFDGFAAWEDFLLKNSTDYIVNYSYYGDWAAPGYACVGGDEGATNAHTEGILMSTGYSYLNCMLLSKMAKEIGRPEDAAKYEETAEKIKAAFLAKWFDAETAKVCGGAEGAQAFALWLDILPEDKRQMAADDLAKDLVLRDYRFTTGNLCTRYMMDMLAKYGHIDVAWEFLHKETYPSYGYMLQNEATTIWERFELKKNGGMNSHNHPMYGALGYFFYAWIAGVTPLTPGYETIRIAPVFPKTLQSAQCVIDSVKGDIAVRWSKRYDSLHLFLQIPFGVTAEVVFGGKAQTLGSGYHVLECPIA